MTNMIIPEYHAGIKLPCHFHDFTNYRNRFIFKMEIEAYSPTPKITFQKQIIKTLSWPIKMDIPWTQLYLQNEECRNPKIQRAQVC